ncbi:carbohydrate ABC transporter permease [Clostridium sp. 19966]|uniref:carbohydrate ABC transporter permease n=1 Tax=Clostridium sp. 19966 TaxID=2768166 RepID=UPI0028DFDE30|nr:carbohydrate ABC transporter permease [Clostridium sp. 19966]MDT8715522.1 carbohydrate ABC transporter permease [Clostridium sp. 19966]
MELAKNKNTPALKTRKKVHFTVGKIVLYIFLIALAVLCFIPFYIMIINATHSNAEIASKLSLIPGKDFLNNYNRMQQRINIWNGFKNSIIISFSATLLAAYFGGLTAYGFSKFKFKGNKFLFAIVLMTLMIPPQLGILGFFRVIRFLDLMNSRLALILPSIATANIVFFMKLYIDSSVPDSLMESARIDGCGEFKIYNKIVMPIITPALATMSIFTFISTWNNYLTPLIVLNDEDKYTVPILTAMAKGTYQTDFGAVYMCIALSIIPIMLVFLFCSKYIIGGVTVGAVKG